MTQNFHDIEQYLEIAELFGKRIKKSQGCWWEESRRFGYIPAPAGLPYPVSPQDIQQMFWREGALALRVFSNQPGDGQLSFYHACRDRDYDLSSLKSEARRKVIKGLEYCHVRELEKDDFNVLFEEGLKINQSALHRQKRVGRSIFRDPNMWRRLLEALMRNSAVRTYGTFVETQLCAYIIIFQSGKKALCFHTFSSTDFFRFYPNNAMLFYVTKDIMMNCDVDEFYLKWGSISQNDSLTSLDEFILNLGFKEYPIWQSY